jgi:phosphoribosylcarboxyaminoimidazole (NCAIR) mutase
VDFETLEARRLLCSTHLIDSMGISLLATAPPATGSAGVSSPAQAAIPARGEATPTSTTSTATVSALPSAPPPLAPNGLPLLHSLPGARVAVYLDFGGSGAAVPYDTDGVPDAFGAAERSDVVAAWRHVASYFSMFDVDVTTERPPAAAPFSHSLVSNSIEGGYNIGSFPSVGPTNFDASSDARNRRSALAHEIGHSFGLQHQSLYDHDGTKLSEYFLGFDRLHGPIMGMDAARDVSKWWIGHPASSPYLFQDDLAVISGKIRGFAGGDGFRADDVPDSLAQARLLAGAAGGGATGVLSASGIIERMDDADAFSFASAGGKVSLDLVPPKPSMLDAKLEVYSAGGVLIAAADAPDANDQHLAFGSLPAGSYYAVVKSHGDYADLGPYDLTLRQSPADGAPGPRYNHLPAPQGVRAAPGAGTGLEVRWFPVRGATGYSLERSDDGVTWATVYASGDMAAVAYTDPTLTPGTRYFYRVSATDDAGRSAPSSPANATTRVAGPTDLYATQWGDNALVLNWRDTSGETEYRVERAAVDEQGNTGPWAVVGRVAANTPGFADQFVALEGRYHYRVFAASAAGDAANAPGVSASVALTSVRGVQVTGRRPARIDLAWEPIRGAVGYVIERSDDGKAFTAVGAVATGASFSDTSVVPAHPYSYRVVGTNDLGETARSVAVLTATPAAVAPPPGWDVSDLGAAATGAAARLAGDGVDYGADVAGFSLIGGGIGSAARDGTGVFADALRFVYRTVTGDFSVTARVATPLYGSAGTTAGVMIRDGADAGAAASADAGSPFVFAGTSADGYNGYQARGQRDARASDVVSTGRSADCWVRLVRTGDTIDVYGMPSGNTWQWWHRYTQPMPATLNVGLAASAGGNAALSLAKFDNVSLAAGNSPIIEEVAAARPAVVDGDRTTLSVLADDDGGETGLRYTWSVLEMPPGAPTPAISDNGTHNASHAVATFFGAGRYLFRVTVVDAAGLSVFQTVPVEVRPTLTSVTVSPVGLVVPAGGTVQFTPRALDQFGRPYPAGAAGEGSPPGSPPAAPITWAAFYGQIDESGSYTAPAGWSGREVITTYVGDQPTLTDIFVYDPAAGPALLSAASRKVHGRRGPVDLPLALFGTAPTVEPRRGGPATLRLTFSKPVAAADGSLDAGDFRVEGATFRSAQIDGPVLTLELAGVLDRGLVTVSFSGLRGVDGAPLQGQTTLKARALYADANGDGAVNAADFAALRGQMPRPPAGADLLRDLDLDGTVTALDLLIVRRRFGATVG